MTEDISARLQAVGPRIKTLREARELTLQGVSNATGISVSTLSRLESGARKATLELLLPLSHLYDVPLDDLVGSPQVGDPRVHLRKNRVSGQTVISLSHENSEVRAFKHVLDPAPEPARPQLQTHHGSEWIYVLSGAIRLVLGHQEFVLNAGEAAQFETTIPHWFGNALPDAPSEYLGLFNMAGESLHAPHYRKK